MLAGTDVDQNMVFTNNEHQFWKYFYVVVGAIHRFEYAAKAILWSTGDISPCLEIPNFRMFVPLPYVGCKEL